MRGYTKEKKAKYTEVQEALIELIEKDGLSLSQMEWMLKFLQGNGYVEEGTYANQRVIEELELILSIEEETGIIPVNALKHYIKELKQEI
jgi:hypothetical protein